ncbi:hypothetical protein [Rhodococcus sovatensis]|uniref:Uncharacterized protein n=1 Tax=Rhodococcus sovatensis TaxID=1805840 RepID=A0ABZ2PP34_9NOCA
MSAARAVPVYGLVGVRVLGLRYLLPWSGDGQVVDDDLAVVTVGSVS